MPKRSCCQSEDPARSGQGATHREEVRAGKARTLTTIPRVELLGSWDRGPLPALPRAYGAVAKT